MENPWKIIDEQKVYNNNWISIHHFNVINPSGKKGIYGKVHMKNIAIGIVPLDEEMNTWLVGQYRFVLNEYSWEIPEGGAPFHESPLEAAKRELLEETGLQAQSWRKIQELSLSNSVTDERAEIYVARTLSQHKPLPEDTEQITIKKLPFEEVYQMVSDGRITDGLSVTAILKVKLLLSEGRL